MIAFATIIVIAIPLLGQRQFCEAEQVYKYV